MWLIIPLIYFLGWWQTNSFRQAFNGTIAWIIGYGIFAGTILALDVGGYDGISATPDSPMAGLAILGGFIGMWISNIVWRRRGGDPPRKHGKWERTFRAMFGADQKKKKKPARKALPPQPQQPAPPPQQYPPQQAPVEAQYRPAPDQVPPPYQQPNQPSPPQYQPAPQQQFVQQPAPPPQQHGAPQPSPAQTTPRKKASSSNPAVDKYAKATGRALGAMFRGSNKKKSRNSGSQ